MTGISIAIRSLQLAAALLLTGICTFLLLVVRPACQAAKTNGLAVLEYFDVKLLRLAGWSILIMLLTGLLGLWGQLATVTERPLFQALAPEVIWRFLISTQYGCVWIIRMGLMALLGGILWWRDRERDGRDWWALRLEVAGLAVCILTAQAWTGHAATGDGLMLAYQVLADGIHLFAGGIWLGSLPLLACFLRWAQDSNDPDAELIASEATRRFSALGLMSMSLLILSGLANAWELVGTIPALVGTTYGRLLLLKVSLLLPVLAIAALNLFHEKPRLLQSISGPEPTDTRKILRHLRRNVLVEMMFGAAILLLVGALGVMPPAYHEQPTWPFSFRLSWEATKDLPGVRTSAALGMQLSMFGFFSALLALITRVRRWPWLTATGLVAVAVGFALWLPKLTVDAYPTTYVRPPVPYNALSIANGLQLYNEHCAVCHGIEGYGDGPAAAGLKPRPADLTAKHTADHTAGDMFWWLTYGLQGTAMPGFRDRLNEEERWDLINIIRLLSASEQALALDPMISPTLRVVAPDFSYTTPLGDTRALKDFRGQDQVLLVFFSLPESHERLIQLQELYAKVRPLGVEILAVALQQDSAGDTATSHLPVAFPLIRDGASEAATTYGLFRRNLSSAHTDPDASILSHVEFLIDRQGYVRGRWIPRGGAGWSDPEQLMAAIEVLRHEKLDALPPDLHVH